MPSNYGEAYAKAFERAFADLAKNHRTALAPNPFEGFAGISSSSRLAASTRMTPLRR
jgi:hypothetical protein